MYPSHGVAMKTEFNVSCANWRDENSPLTYEYSFEISGGVTVFFSSIGKPGEQNRKFIFNFSTFNRLITLLN